MNTLEAISKRKSTREYKPEQISKENLDVVLKAGMYAPVAMARYDLKKANGKDAYELFLSGNQPLVEIKNPQNTSGRKLIVFRDSFASSLMPLLAQGYSQVTMIDLRYINSQLLDKYVDFSEADVLLLYSAGILNNSTSMK